MKGKMPRRMMFQCQKPSAWASTMARVDSERVTSTTVTIVMPRAAS